MWRRMLRASMIVWCCAVIGTPAVGEVRLPGLIGENMVLQQGQPITIWGWASAGEQVSVRFRDQRATAVADADGRWSVQLPASQAGGPFEMSIEGENRIDLKNILVGEVWLCSGQSNMEWTVAGSKDAKEEIAAANSPAIRHIKITHAPAASPQAEVASGGWLSATPEHLGNFSAVGYYFGRYLQQQLDVPIGLIGCNWGGTMIEPWIPPDGFRQVPALRDIAEKLDQFPATDSQGNIIHQSPTALYNGMIAPLVPLKIQGVIWYQGESNNGDAMLYHEKMKALIAGWRGLWKRPEMPFYYVQLAPYRYSREPKDLAEIWDAQRQTLLVPHTGMAVTTDIGEVGDIHPKNKQDVGKRLALWALAKTYGDSDLVYSGPLFKSAARQDGRVVVNFDQVGGGLVSRDGQPLTEFQLAGADGQFSPAQATIQGQEVVVSCEAVPEPVALRFAWHQEANPNLANAEGLPASPFQARLAEGEKN